MSGSQGVAVATFYVNDEAVSKDALVVEPGDLLKSLTFTLPLRAGFLGGGFDVRVRVEFNPPMVPTEWRAG